MIQQRNLRMRQEKKAARRKLYKKIITNLNVGVLLLSTAALTHIQGKSAEVFAQNSSRKFSPEEFINKIGSSAKNIASKNNLYASVMIAQAALESGWGSSRLAQAPNHNLFGVKASKDQPKVNMPTLEDDGSGNYYQIQDNFRKYSSYEESLQDYADLLSGKKSEWTANYYKGALKSNTSSYQDATQHLTGRYATDTRYGGKLNQLIETYQLTKYDGESANRGQLVETVEASVTNPTYGSSVVTSHSVAGMYSIKAGDSLYGIARQHGINVKDLMAANGLRLNSVIHPNQQLAIPGSQTKQVNKPVTPISSPTASESQTNSNQTELTRNTGRSQGSYTIKAGDSLYGIAGKLGVNINELVKANGLTLQSIIYPNQSLRVPGQASSAPINNVVTVETPTRTTEVTSTVETTVANQPVSSVSSNGSYVVKAGDSLWGIANRHGMTLQALLSANGMKANSLIVPGQAIRVSGSTVQTTKTSTVETTVIDNSTPTVQQAPVKQETEAATVAESTTAEVRTSTKGISHQVKAGDTLYSIARQYGVDVYQLIKVNGGTNIYIGQVINI